MNDSKNPLDVTVSAERIYPTIGFHSMFEEFTRFHHNIPYICQQKLFLINLI